MQLKIKLEQEADGRWIAEIEGLPGVLAYGASADEALTDAQYPGGYRVWVRFSDAVEGEIDLESELWGEMFDPLKDVSLFAQMQLNKELGTIVWPNGADFAPEFLYQKLRPDYTLKSPEKSSAA